MSPLERAWGEYDELVETMLFDWIGTPEEFEVQYQRLQDATDKQLTKIRALTALEGK